jgi:hypothetical protein
MNTQRLKLTFVVITLAACGATPESLRKLIPKSLPSGRPVHQFQ